MENNTFTISQNRSLRQWLFNPFQFIAGGKALLLGIVIILATAYIGSFGNTHFDGVLDVHTGQQSPVWLFFAEGIIDWLSISIMLLIAAFIISRSSFRIIDIFGTQALARFPFFAAVFFTLPKGITRFGEYLSAKAMQQTPAVTLQSTDVVFFVLATVVILVMLVWMVVLMYRAYAVSCNVKGGKAIGSFAVGLIIAEILSKLALWLVVTQTHIKLMR